MTIAVRQKSPVGLSFGRINAIVLRHYYLLKGSWARIIELAYWPAMQMIIWGFTTQFFISHSSWVAQATGVLVSTVAVRLQQLDMRILISQIMIGRRCRHGREGVRERPIR